MRDDGDDVLAADRILLPGVGAFGAAMERLVAQDLVEPLRERLRAGWPTLAVCVGLQLLARGSAEADGVEGLGALDVHVGRFENDVRVPHMGWNRVDGTWLERGHAYFANSFRIDGDARATLEADGWDVARCDYGGPFVAAVRRDGILACQFHPELSGAWGLELLRDWIARTEEDAAC